MEHHAESAHDSGKNSGPKHLTSKELVEDAYYMTKLAESATPDMLKQLDDQLAKAKKSLSAEQYGELLKDMRAINAQDVRKNSHLPTITFTDSTNSGIPDHVNQQYADAAKKK